MKKIFLITIATFFISNIFAQTAPEEIIKSFFTTYPKNTNKAIDDLYATNPWTVRIKEGIDNIKKEINGYTVDYVGKYYGYELITRKQFAESFILFSYMIKYDRQPIRFTFELYKPNDK